MEKIKIRLLDRQSELLARLERTHEHLMHKQPGSPNSHEQLTETANDDVVQALDQEGREELVLVMRALDRIDSGEYYTCTVCGKEIGAARLEAIPYTDRCVNCAKNGSR